MRYKWHCCNKCFFAKWLQYVTWDKFIPWHPNFPSVRYLLLRHHQRRQTLINNKTCKGFTYLSVTPLFTRLKKKKKKRNKKTCGILGTALFCSAAFIGRAKFEQVKKKGLGSRFFFFFLSFIIHRHYYIQFQHSYFRPIQEDLLPSQPTGLFQKFYNSQQRA